MRIYVCVLLFWLQRPPKLNRWDILHIVCVCVFFFFKNLIAFNADICFLVCDLYCTVLHVYRFIWILWNSSVYVLSWCFFGHVQSASLAWHALTYALNDGIHFVKFINKHHQNWYLFWRLKCIENSFEILGLKKPIFFSFEGVLLV